ncbi:hypothetical protein D3C80_2126280 [compost metagenome]
MPAWFSGLLRDVFGQGRLECLGNERNQKGLGTRLHIATNFGLPFFHFSGVL